MSIQKLIDNIRQNKISIARFITRLIYLGLLIAAITSKQVVFIIAIAGAVLLGPIFCGWLCFFGFFQDVMRYIGSLFKKKPFDFSYNVDKYLQFSRYIILAGGIIAGGVFLLPNAVKSSLMGILKGHPQVNIALYVLIGLAILALFTNRFYCRYCCAFGAQQGLYSLLRIFTINRDAKKCSGCKACSEVCPMHIEVHKVSSLSNPNCISCFSCVEKCNNKALTIGFRNIFQPVIKFIKNIFSPAQK